MPAAIFRNDQGEERKFDMYYCPVHVMWRGRLWALQATDPKRPNVFVYRDTTVMDLAQLTVNVDAAEQVA